MLRRPYDELGLTQEEMEQAEREALEPALPMREEEPFEAELAQARDGMAALKSSPVKTQAPPAPVDTELMAARESDDTARVSRDLKSWGDSFADSVMFAPVGHGYKPVAQPSARPSEESRLLTDRSSKARAASSAEKAKQSELEAKALAEWRKMQGDDRAADNARADKTLSEMERHNLAMENRRQGKPVDPRKRETEDFKDSSSLRQEFSGLPETKAFKEVSAAYDKVKRSANDPSAAGDLSLIFAYMKMLDPGSTVREGEFANAQNSAGLDDRLVAKYNKLLKGERLGPDQRKDFINQARGLYAAQRSQFDSQRKRYEGLAKKRGLDPADVTFDFQEPGMETPGAQGERVPMISATSGATIMLDPATAERLLKSGKVRRP